MIEKYLYTSQDKIPKEAIADIDELKNSASKKEDTPSAPINVVLDVVHNKLEILFHVTELDYETKHEIDVKIRRLLKKHKIKFIFSNPGHIKFNLY